ncbi:MAG: HD domain-containing protein [Fimbriimonadaceae bacterium]|nr:HD domain-containing protein [Fimbriimonadaceae bacterium]QYK55702.1 MAG: HD domain-containing protein [Fimbriimonadaceae bacterium]
MAALRASGVYLGLGFAALVGQALVHHWGVDVHPLAYTLEGAGIVALSAALIYYSTRRLVADIDRTHEESLEAKLDLVNRLALAAEYRDEERRGHNFRIGRTSELLAQAVGLDPETATLIGQAAVLHDIGKIGVPDSILSKPGALTPDERVVVQQHVHYGARLLEGSSLPLLQMAERIALTHHERWDGTGYPYGLSGAQTPIAGRIVAVTDVFDALVSERPYKRAWSLAEARDYILKESGRLFDPEIVVAFGQRFEEIQALYRASEESAEAAKSSLELFLGPTFTPKEELEGARAG